MDQKELRRYLNVIKRAVSLIEGMLEMDDDGMLEKLMDTPIHQPQPVQQIAPPQPVQALPQPEPEPEEVVEPEPDPAVIAARKGHIAQLLEIDCWPEAVTSRYTKEPKEEDHIKRANAALHTMLTESVDGKVFLDFGCGDGWIANQVIERGVSESHGYDIKESNYWKQHKDNVVFSTDWGEVPKNHFDFVMLYDVLDHVVDPIEVMGQVKESLKKDGRVYIRCHPWTCRHGSHLYQKGLNKAFIHLFLSNDEIEEVIGEPQMFTRQEINPIEAYHWWFNEFEIVKERVQREQISEFFHVPAFKDLLSAERGIPRGKDFDDFMERMELVFVDYELILS